MKQPNKTPKKAVSIKKYRHRADFNIGMIIFLIILIYLVANVIGYATRRHVPIFEVRMGRILQDTNYVGLVLREELVVHAAAGGYVYYFQNPQSKIRAGSNLYAISPFQLVLPELLEEEAITIHDDEFHNMVLRAQSFNENFEPNRFSSVYSFRNDVLNNISGFANQAKTTQLDAVIQSSGGTAQIFPVSRDGVFVSRIDGLENVTMDSFEPEMLDRSNYEFFSLHDQMRVESGTPAYKLVTSESWAIIIEIDEAMAAQLETMQYVQIRIDKDNSTLWAVPTVFYRGEQAYAYLSLDNSMIRYVDERFLNIEVILAHQTGLMIPRSAVIEREFFVVPEHYVGWDEESRRRYVTLAGSGIAHYITPFRITNEGLHYLNPADFEQTPTIVDLDGNNPMQLVHRSHLPGVFNVNQGFAIFRMVNIIGGNEEYYIIEGGNLPAIQNFDRIVQDGSSVTENEVVVGR